MNLDGYKRALLDLRTRLSARLAAEDGNGQEQRLDVPGDSADTAAVDESGSEDFSEAELDSAVLTEIDAALCRMDDGTYGRCLVDGGPIEPKRLDAVPWAAYCVEHQTLIEPGDRPKPTL
jgi:DnaK suppressor protein